jgi:hypothetical protein
VRSRLVTLMFVACLAACQQILGIEDGDVRTEGSGGEAGNSGGQGGNTSNTSGAGGDVGSGGGGGTFVIRGPLVFTTKGTYTSGTEFTNVNGADALCATEGLALPGTYVAWISEDGQPAIDRIPDGGPWYQPGDSRPTFTTKASITLVGPAVPIDRGPDAMPVSGLVFTGTNDDGTPTTVDCDDWKGGAQLGTFGYLNNAFSGWSNSADVPCDSVMAHFYCFQVLP